MKVAADGGLIVAFYTLACKYYQGDGCERDLNQAAYWAQQATAFETQDSEKARQLLAEAGYPGGIDPATGERLRFTFDQTGNSSAYRQLGELTAADFARAAESRPDPPRCRIPPETP